MSDKAEKAAGQGAQSGEAFLMCRRYITAEGREKGLLSHGKCIHDFVVTATERFAFGKQLGEDLEALINKAIEKSE